jgi:hypothetical protein
VVGWAPGGLGGGGGGGGAAKVRRVNALKLMRDSAVLGSRVDSSV